MGYRKIEQQIIPAKHLITIGERFNSLALKQAFANVPDDATLWEISKNDDGTYTLTFVEKV